MKNKESATVLVVDDDPFVLEFIKEQILKYGYQAILASSGEEALQVAKQKIKIDLLLTDIVMPGIDGLDLARQFISLYPETKVLFMSGFYCPPIAQYISGAEEAFLEKPFGRSSLITKIRGALNRPAIQPITPLD